MLFFSLILGKLSSVSIKTFFKRDASTWPGHLVLESNPEFIKNVLNKNPDIKIVLIAGTNGKTTTTKALHHILEKNEIKAGINSSGANLLNGFASLLIQKSNLIGKISADALLFEVDENSLPLLLSKCPMVNGQWSIVLLNLFRDQLDRYGEINTTAEKWKDALSKVNKKATLIANSDDPQIVGIAKDFKGSVTYFSINDNLKNELSLSHAVDSTTCPKCRNDLKYSKIAYSHIGNYSCSKCEFKNPKALSLNIKTNLEGSFNIYNLTASVVTAEKLFNISNTQAINSLEDFKPAFGRQEEIKINDKTIKIYLSKNPTGLNESLKVTIENNYNNLLIVLNDRIPDGRDISWIWDVDFELLTGKNLNITLSGDRTYDLANRLKYSNVKTFKVEENINTALEKALSLTSKNQTLAILPTYSAMLEIRKILTGKSIL